MKQGQPSTSDADQALSWRVLVTALYNELDLALVSGIDGVGNRGYTATWVTPDTTPEQFAAMAGTLGFKRPEHAILDALKDRLALPDVGATVQLGQSRYAIVAALASAIEVMRAVGASDEHIDLLTDLAASLQRAATVPSGTTPTA